MRTMKVNRVILSTYQRNERFHVAETLIVPQIRFL